MAQTWQQKEVDSIPFVNAVTPSIPDLCTCTAVKKQSLARNCSLMRYFHEMNNHIEQKQPHDDTQTYLALDAICILPPQIQRGVLQTHDMWGMSFAKREIVVLILIVRCPCINLSHMCCANVRICRANVRTLSP